MSEATIDGTYSVVSSAIGGSCIAVWSLKSGVVEANDIAGGRATGTFAVAADGYVTFDLSAASPPGTFEIWGTSTLDLWCKRHRIERVALDDIRNGRPIFIEDLELWVIFRRIPDDYAEFAGEQGFAVFASQIFNTLELLQTRPRSAE